MEGCLDLTSRIWLLKASSSLSLSGKSDVLCEEVEGGEPQRTEEVLTLLQREGDAEKRPLGQRGEEVGEGRMLGTASRSIRPELSFASALCVCREVEDVQGTRASPAWPLPCRCSVQNPVQLFLSTVPREWV